MKEFIVYNGQGEILRTGRCAPETFDLQAGPGEFVAEKTDPGLTDETHYHNGGAFHPRSEMGIVVDKESITADGIDKATFTNIPVGTAVEGVIVNDGVLEFTTNAAGKNNLTFKKLPEYRPQHFIITGV